MNSEHVGELPPKKSHRAKLIALVLVLLVAGGVAVFVAGRPSRRDVVTTQPVSTPEVLDAHCEEGVGPPRVLRITDNVLVAVGYDLANTILVTSPEGHVVIDVGMSPARARLAREALLREANAVDYAIIDACRKRNGLRAA